MTSFGGTHGLNLYRNSEYLIYQVDDLSGLGRHDGRTRDSPILVHHQILWPNFLDDLYAAKVTPTSPNRWVPLPSPKTGLQVKGSKSYPITLEMHMENANLT